MFSWRNKKKYLPDIHTYLDLCMVQLYMAGSVGILYKCKNLHLIIFFMQNSDPAHVFFFFFSDL